MRPQRVALTSPWTAGVDRGICACYLQYDARVPLHQRDTRSGRWYREWYALTVPRVMAMTTRCSRREVVPPAFAACLPLADEDAYARRLGDGTGPEHKDSEAMCPRI